jgi:beta-galactosidase
MKRSRAVILTILAGAACGLCLFAGPIFFSSSPADLPAEKPGLLLGVAWYPEQWDEARWGIDLDLMRAAGIRMVRLAEYAWSRMEPREGRFDFDWLERAIEQAGRRGLSVVLGTPTGAPPAWLTRKYPDVMRVDENGRRAIPGGREHYSYSSPRYRPYARRIAEEMAKRFGRHPNVLGWQVDNEYGLSMVSYDEDTLGQFRRWLRARLVSLDALNRRWSTAYWSQTYGVWEEIPFPLGSSANPSLKLEWYRFLSETNRDYTRNQASAIRAHAESRQFITHNFSGDDVFNYFVTARDLTFASLDDYVGTGHLDPARNGLQLDLARGWLRRNFWVSETSPGSGCWRPVNTTPDRGEVRALAWETVGHGAEAVCFWQWRSAPAGREQYHGTLIGADGRPALVYAEVSRIGEEFARLGGFFRGTAPAPRAALLQDYESDWTIQFQKHHQDFDTAAHFLSYYRPLRAVLQDLDVVHPTAPLGGYRLVVAPHLNILTEETARHLLEFVRAGGHLVMGPRSGMKDEDNALLPSRQPGALLGAALGGGVAQFYALDKPVPVSGVLGAGEARIWAEALEPEDENPEAPLRYGPSNGWLDGHPAVLSRRVGAGRITYVGAYLDERTMTALAVWLAERSGLTPAFGPLPAGVEACRRVGSGKEIFVLINHTPEAKSIVLPRPMLDLLNDAARGAALTLPARELAVLVDR